MVEWVYGIKKATSQLPKKDIYEFPHRNGVLEAAVFGPGLYLNNLSQMRGRFFHSAERPEISFEGLTTSESLSLAFQYLDNPIRNILEDSLLQIGRAIQTPEGVAVNVADLNTLNAQLKKSVQIKVGEGHIYLGKEDDFGFAEYGTFKRGFQDGDTFARSGLARVLEHSFGERAEKLGKISSSITGRALVDIRWCTLNNTPLPKVVCLRGGESYHGLIVSAHTLDSDPGVTFGKVLAQK